MAKIQKIELDEFEITDLENARLILNRGGVIAYPTETVYGLGASMHFRSGIDRIYKMKQRDPSKPMSFMITTTEEVETYCRQITPYSRELMRQFWPGPLTLVFKASDEVPDYASGPTNKIAFRIPDHPITSALMQLYGEPVTTTSANVAGKTAAMTAPHVVELFAEVVDLVIDGGECEIQTPSTVVDVTGETPVLLREGSLAFAEIQEAFDNF